LEEACAESHASIDGEDTKENSLKLTPKENSLKLTPKVYEI